MSLAEINNEIISNFEKIAGKLTLFTGDEPKSKKQNTETAQLLERPITPLEHEITDAPKSLQEFLFLLQRRISIAKNSILSEEDQLSLLGILEGEISLIWPDLENLVDYPLFTPDQNRELRYTLFIEIISKCKSLFEEYNNKLLSYNDKEIFSSESNLVRIKLQLSSDIRHKLHIPTLRRHIYRNISDNIHIDIPKCCEKSSIEKKEEQFLLEIYDKKRRLPENTPHKSIQEKSLLKEFNLNQGNSGIIKDQEPEKMSVDFNIKDIGVGQITLNSKKNHDDLLQLIANNDTNEKEKEFFLKISTSNPSLDNINLRNEGLNRKIQNIKKKNDEKENLGKYNIRPPIVEQPSTVQKFYNNKVFCVADIRPTERKSDHEISLSSYGPVWNELVDEVTPEVVKQLDSNLFRGEEVKDIYKEMMKTVSRDYLSYVEDPLIDYCPQKVFIQDIMASHTLQSEVKRDRIINDDLKKYPNSPWKLQSKLRTEWEQPNYVLENSSTSDLDLKQYVAMSLNELSHLINYGRGSYGESLSSTVNSNRDVSTSLAFIAETPSFSRVTPIRNIIAKREYFIPLEKFEKGISRLPKLMQDRLVKQYKEWLSLWKRTFETEDYLKYLSLQPSDFLSVIFHQYDSDAENDDFSEEDLYPEIIEEKLKMTERENERASIVESKIVELRNEKSNFVKGLWNPSTILIGGLGRTPKLTNNERNELLKTKPALQDPSDRFSKMSAYSRAQSAVSPSKHTPLFVKRRNDLRQSDISENPILSDDEDTKLKAIQSRLEKIWNNLKMPNHIRLDMAIKYSTETNLKSIETVLNHWDKATDLLLQRESYLSELERFEKTASDPNRFFAKGYRGSSLARIEESKIRQELNEKISEYSMKVSNAMHQLKSTFSDELTFEGRPYADKMIWDRTEMLYWLQEERKDRCVNGATNYLTIS